MDPDLLRSAVAWRIATAPSAASKRPRSVNSTSLAGSPLMRRSRLSSAHGHSSPPPAIGPRPDLIGQHVAAARGEPRDSPYVTGRVEGVEPGTEVAVAVDGVIEATTRTYSNGGHTFYAAIVPPSSLPEGAKVALLQILPGGGLRPVTG